MIERLLAAEAALARGELELAGRLFAQVAEADPRNAIAVVGLARIARLDGRDQQANELAERALQIDPDEAAAGRLLRELAAAAEPGAAPEPVPPAAEPGAPAASAPLSVVERIMRWLAGLRRRR